MHSPYTDSIVSNRVFWPKKYLDILWNNLKYLVLLITGLVAPSAFHSGRSSAAFFTTGIDAGRLMFREKILGYSESSLDCLFRNI